MRVILFTEQNSPYGATIMDRIAAHPATDSLMVVTRDPSVFCDYYQFDEMVVSVPDLARNRGFPLIQSDYIESESSLGKFRQFRPHLIVLANYQLKVKSCISNLACQKTINFHPSPLPRYAGLAPFFWMAKNGETDAGVSCCLVDDKIDAGAVVGSRQVKLSGHETSGEIRDILFAASYELVTPVLDLFAKGVARPEPQDIKKRSYYSKPTLTDLTIDWSQPTVQILRTIRAGSPLPGSIMLLPNGKQIRIRDAHPVAAPTKRTAGTLYFHLGLPVIHTGDGAVRVTSYASYCPDAPETPSVRPIRFDSAFPPPKHSAIAMLSMGARS